MSGCSAGGDDDAGYFLRLFGRQVELWQPDGAFIEVHPPSQGVRQRAHLFMNFLLHEMAVLALFRCYRVPADVVLLCCYRTAIQILHAIRSTRHHCHLVRFEKYHRPGVIQNRRNIGGNEHFILAQANNHPAGIPNTSGDQFIRFERRKHHHPMRTL